MIVGKIANLLFPADYFDKKQPDGEMRTVSLVRPFLDSELPLIYRGWMMKLGEYESFHRSLVRLGLRPITSPEAYAESHMFPLLTRGTRRRARPHQASLRFPALRLTRVR